MESFQLCLPTKVIFGKGEYQKIGEYLKPYATKILLHYGGGSIKRSGLYDKVVFSLNQAGIEFVELGGVQPNPRVELTRQGIELARKENVQLILAVGGGSVIDSSKGIAIGVPYEGDVWDLYDKENPAKPQKALPVATILTIPAAGSETSASTVLSNMETGRKYGCSSELVRPVLSILSPDLCLTLPKNQAANGICDMMAHIMERYFSPSTHVDVTDRMCEGVLRSIMNNGKKLMEDYENYDLWAEIMWAGSIAHNGILGVGRKESWVSHGLEHELSAIYDIPHGQGLAIVFPAWIKTVWKENPTRFVQFAIRVMDVDLEYYDQEAIILEGVRRLEEFFTSIGLPTRLHQIGIDNNDFEKMSKAVERIKKTSFELAMEVYQTAL